MTRQPKGFIYFAVAGEFVKIGYATRPLKRIANLQTGCPHTIRLATAKRGWRYLEHLHHLRFSYLSTRETGEWFHLRGELKEYIEHLLSGGPLYGMDNDSANAWCSSEWTSTHPDDTEIPF